jgi:hypothetical protein
MRFPVLATALALSSAFPPPVLAGKRAGESGLSASEERELDALLAAPPRFHLQAGPLFSGEGFSYPGIDGETFGGGLEAGATLARLARTYELGASVCGEWIAADPLRGLAGGGDKFVAWGYRVTLQNLARYVDGVGFRFGLGADHVFKRERGRPGRMIVPTYSFTVMAQTETGLYLYLELGGIIYRPVILGLGFDL